MFWVGLPSAFACLPMDVTLDGAGRLDDYTMVKQQPPPQIRSLYYSLKASYMIPLIDVESARLTFASGLNALPPLPHGGPSVERVTSGPSEAERTTCWCCAASDDKRVRGSVSPHSPTGSIATATNKQINKRTTTTKKDSWASRPSHLAILRLAALTAGSLLRCHGRDGVEPRLSVEGHADRNRREDDDAVEEETPLAGAGTGAGERQDWIHELALLTQMERHCPDILPYPAAFVGHVTALLAERQMDIERRAAQEREEATHMVNLLPLRPSDVMLLELQRARFFLTEFLRCRLRKIEVLCSAIYYEGLVERQQHRRAEREAGEEESSSPPSSPAELEERTLVPPSFPQRSHLSPNEAVVADRLAASLRRAVLQAGLHLAPPALQHLLPQPEEAEGLEILPQPRMDTYVFGRATVDLGEVALGEEATQQIQQGDIFLVPYSAFRPYVLSGAVQLL
eukprot:gene2306-1443_t